MADEKTVDYQAVLADLEARRATLDAAIEAVRSLAGVAPSGAVSAVAKDAQEFDATDIPAGAFHGLSIAAATRKYLAAVKRNQSTREIAEALKKGGLHSGAKSYTTTIYSVLGRQADIVRVGNDWGLASWHPGYARAGKVKGAKADSGTIPKARERSAKSRHRKIRTRKARTAQRDRTVASPPHASGDLGSLRGRVLAVVDAHPQKTWSADTVLPELDGPEELRRVQSTLARLANAQAVTKVAPGRYRSRAAQADKGHAASA